MIAPPTVESAWDAKSRVLNVAVKFPAGVAPQNNVLSWSINRHAPHTLAFEYDAGRQHYFKLLVTDNIARKSTSTRQPLASNS
jgi:hypothetical protein